MNTSDAPKSLSLQILSLTAGFTTLLSMAYFVAANLLS